MQTSILFMKKVRAQVLSGVLKFPFFIQKSQLSIHPSNAKVEWININHFYAWLRGLQIMCSQGLFLGRSRYRTYDHKSSSFFHGECPVPILFGERIRESKFNQHCFLHCMISEPQSCYSNCNLITLVSLWARDNVKLETPHSTNSYWNLFFLSIVN